MSKIFQEAFVATVARYKLQVKWLSEESGVSTATITRLKTGSRDIYMESFAEVFQALPIEAKRFFLEKLLGDAIAENVSLTTAVNKLDPTNTIHRKQAADALRLIVEKFITEDHNPKSRENTEELVSVR
jgi:DNA-binding Xre family transcriptional regulator